MLYASSRGMLVSTLGLRGQRLVSQIVATTPSELTFPVEAEESLSLSQLSIREKELAEAKAAETEDAAARGTSSGKRSNFVSSSGFAFPVSDDARNAIAA